MHELREQTVRHAADRAAVAVDDHRKLSGRPSGRREQQSPDFHAVERLPLDRFEIAEGEIVQLGIDVGQLHAAAVRGIEDEDVAHRSAVDGAVRDTAAVVAERDRVVDAGAGGDALRFAAVDRQAHQRLFEHLLRGGERPLVCFVVDCRAVARPDEVVHPRAVVLQHARRAARGRDDGEAARRHQLRSAVR